MINFMSELDKSFATPDALQSSSQIQVAPVVTQSVTIRRPETRATHVSAQSSAWTWENLRDYVVSRIEATSGPFPRDPLKEKGVFSGFVTRWGVLAGPIAEFAFETMEGRWKGSPVSVNRFCKASDPYFAKEIAERLR